MPASEHGYFRRLDIPQDDTGLSLAGFPLSDYGLWLRRAGWSLGEGDHRTSMTDMPGRNGTVDMSQRDEMGKPYVARRTLALQLATTGDEDEYWETRRKLKRIDGIETDVGWRSMPGTLTGIPTVGAWEETRTRTGVFMWANVELTVECDPFARGRLERFTATVSPKDVWVDTDRPTAPTITTVPPYGTKRLYLTIGDRQLVYNFDGNGADGSTTLKVDCDAKTSVYGSTPVFPTIDSDYPTLVRGSNTASTTAGSMDVVYRPLYEF